MPLKKVYLLPIIQGIWYPVTFATTYALAVINNDITPLLSYISDSGVWSIERCIFSFMLGLGALMMYIILYIRYRQVKEVLENDKETKFSPILHTLNLVSVYLTVISVLGIFVVGCFQVNPYIYIHLFGAGIAFTCGWIVLALQTYISFKLFPVFGTKVLNIVRLLLVIVIGVALSVATVFGGISLLLFTGNDITKWNESHGGFKLHVISCASEWVLVLGVVLYLTLYANEFKTVVLYKPKLEIINKA